MTNVNVVTNFTFVPVQLGNRYGGRLSLKGEFDQEVLLNEDTSVICPTTPEDDYVVTDSTGQVVAQFAHAKEGGGVTDCGPCNQVFGTRLGSSGELEWLMRQVQQLILRH